MLTPEKLDLARRMVAEGKGRAVIARMIGVGAATLRRGLNKLTGEAQNMPDFPTVFMSYSWDSDDHKYWVRLLAEHLVSNGVHVHLDEWDVLYGESLTQFMEEKIPESDFVLIICTPAYAVKSVQRQGGVGYEAQIVSARIAASIPRSKFVPVIRSGELKPGEPNCAIPPHFQGIRTVDMREEAQYNTMFENLLRHINGQPAVKRPPLGKAPSTPPTPPHPPPRLTTDHVGPVTIPPGETRNFSLDLKHEGPVDLIVQNLVPDWTGREQQRVRWQQAGRGNTPEVVVNICSATGPCPDGVQKGNAGTLRRHLPSGPATITIFNFGENPAVVFSGIFRYPE